MGMCIDRASQNKYGFLSLIRDQLDLPKWLPIEAEFQIGWEIALDEMNKRNYNLIWSRRIQNHFSKSGFKAHILENPFIYYRNKNNIKQNESASGTVVFPYHSDEGWLVDLDIKNFCSRLESLSKIFKPITICLHFLDYINDDVRKAYEEYFNVVTAGDIYDKAFVQKFYEILSENKYSTSNAISTYTFYSINMGIPFFITEVPFKTINRQQSNIEGVGSKRKLLIYPEYQKAFHLFNSHDKNKITPQQIEYVKEEMGLCITNNTNLIKLNLFIFGIIKLLKTQIKKNIRIKQIR